MAGGCAAPSTLAITVSGTIGVGVPERIVQHRPQVLLELAGARPVHGPVSGVVRPHRQLVDQQLARRSSRTTRRPARPPHPVRAPTATPAAGLRRPPLRAARARARSPARRSRRAARSPPPATPRPARTVSAPPAPTVRGAAATRSSTSTGTPSARYSPASSPACARSRASPHAPAVVAAPDRLDHQRCRRPARRRRGYREVVDLVEPM